MSTAVARDKGLSSTTSIDCLPKANSVQLEHRPSSPAGPVPGWLSPAAGKVQPFGLPGLQQTSLTAAIIRPGVAGLLRLREVAGPQAFRFLATAVWPARSP